MSATEEIVHFRFPFARIIFLSNVWPSMKIECKCQKMMSEHFTPKQKTAVSFTNDGIGAILSINHFHKLWEISPALIVKGKCQRCQILPRSSPRFILHCFIIQAASKQAKNPRAHPVPFGQNGYKYKNSFITYQTKHILNK